MDPKQTQKTMVRTQVQSNTYGVT